MRKKNTGTHQSVAPVSSVPKTRPARAVEHALAQKHSRPVDPPQPTSEEIAKLAYSYWEARGCQGGSPEEDWFRAQRELLEQLNAAGTFSRT